MLEDHERHPLYPNCKKATQEQIQQAVNKQPKGICGNCKQKNQILFQMVNYNDGYRYCIRCITSGRVTNPTGLGFC